LHVKSNVISISETLNERLMYNQTTQKQQIMKTHKKHLNKKSNSKISTSNESIWFFSESTTDRNTYPGDQKPIRQNKTSNKIPKQIEENLSGRKQRNFIVDWEIND